MAETTRKDGGGGGRRRLAGALAAVLAATPLRQIVDRVADSLSLERRGRLGAPSIRGRTNRSLQILVYHRVNDDGDWVFPAVAARDFECQMDVLRRRFAPINLEEGLARLEAGTLPAGAVAVTFDDGYRDNHDVAFPILRALGVPATVFLATDAIGTGRRLWHDRVFDAFRRSGVARIDLREIGLGEPPLGSRSEKLAAMRGFLAHVRTLDGEARDRRIDRLVAALGVEEPATDAALMLGWDEVAAMARGGIEFGSHTCSHPILSRISKEALARELEESRRRIEARLGRQVRSIAYPNGTPADFDAGVLTAVRDAGYRFGLTTVFGSNHRGADPLALRRGGPWETDPALFGLKLSWYRLTR